MILLDTNALLWLQAGHPRARPLQRHAGRLRMSPVSLLELQMLVEQGRLRLQAPLRDWLDDDRWAVDDPAATELMLEAIGIGWTRDPFDRLLVAHARLRGWQLATSDRHVLEHVASSDILELRISSRYGRGHRPSTNHPSTCRSPWTRAA